MIPPDRSTYARRELWEGDKYRAIVGPIEAERVVCVVQVRRVKGWGDIVDGHTHATFLPIYRTFVGYREPETRMRWWHRLGFGSPPRSISEAVAVAVADAQKMEREWSVRQREKERTAIDVDAAVEVQEIAASL